MSFGALVKSVTSAAGLDQLYLGQSDRAPSHRYFLPCPDTRDLRGRRVRAIGTLKTGGAGARAFFPDRRRIRVSRTSLAATAAMLAAASFTACDQAATSLPESATFLELQAVSSRVPAGAQLNRQFAALRRATAPFHNFDKAVAAGWDAQLTDCLEQLPEGAQGYHYGNVALIDGTVSLRQPELLLYEPQAGGHLRLVGVEYIVPLSEPQPPPLFGHEFHANEAVGLWALHVWIWRHNPRGIFEDWNPKVSCKHAS